MNYICNMYVVIIDAFFDSSLYMYCPCRLRCMLGNSFSWACSVVHQRFTRHTKYLWLFGYFPSPLNKMINKNILMITSDDLKKEICLLSEDAFWMQICLDPKHDCIWYINQSTSQTVDWKIKVEKEKKHFPKWHYNYAWVRRHVNRWIKYCGQSNHQTIVKKKLDKTRHILE